MIKHMLEERKKQELFLLLRQFRVIGVVYKCKNLFFKRKKQKTISCKIYTTACYFFFCPVDSKKKKKMKNK